MNFHNLAVGLCLLAASLGGCGLPGGKFSAEMTLNPTQTSTQMTPSPMKTPSLVITTPTPMALQVTTTPIGTPLHVTPNPVSTMGFFIDTGETRSLPEEPHIIRYRFVKIHLDLLMDESGQAREVKEIVLNLFPDVTYVGVVKEVIQSGDGYIWSGYLKGVATSYFSMVVTSGVFMGHFASPEGIYEAVIVDGDLYRVIMIDQTKFPGGDS